MLSPPQPSPRLTEALIGEEVALSRGSGIGGVAKALGTEHLLIVSGAVLLSGGSSNGGRVNIAILGPGSILTPEKLKRLLCEPKLLKAEVLRDARFIRIKSADWESATKQLPDLQSWVLEQEAHQLRMTLLLLAQSHQRSSIDRVRFILCTFAQAIGLRAPTGCRIIKVSRTELAAWIGVSNDRACRLIRELHDLREIEVRGRSIVISGLMIARLYPGPRSISSPSAAGTERCQG